MILTRTKRLHLHGALLLLVLPATALLSRGRAECFSTPQAALAGSPSDRPTSVTSEEAGYKVLRIQTDQLLGRSWTIVASCDHPEWSTRAFPILTASSMKISGQHAASAPLPIVVHAGDTVRIWRREAMLRIEVAGTSEQNGSVGDAVRVRLQSSNDGAAAPEELTCTVQGPSDVEMKP